MEHTHDLSNYQNRPQVTEPDDMALTENYISSQNPLTAIGSDDSSHAPDYKSSTECSEIFHEAAASSEAVSQTNESTINPPSRHKMLGKSATSTAVDVLPTEHRTFNSVVSGSHSTTSTPRVNMDSSRPTERNEQSEPTPPQALNEAQLEQFNNLMPLVRKIAKGAWATTMTHEDLVAEGAIGLIYAIQRYDPSKGASLRTLAHKYVHGYIQRAIRDTDRIVRPPRVETREYDMYQNALATLQSEGLRPTTQQIAERSKLPLKVVERVALLASGNLGVGSLDNTLPGRPNADSIPSEAADYSEQIAVMDLVQGLLDSLGERDRKIISMLHGFPPYKEAHSQTDVADELGISQMYVSRLRKKILAELREAIEMQDAR